MASKLINKSKRRYLMAKPLRTIINELAKSGGFGGGDDDGDGGGDGGHSRNPMFEKAHEAFSNLASRLHYASKNPGGYGLRAHGLGNLADAAKEYKTVAHHIANGHHDKAITALDDIPSDHMQHMDEHPGVDHMIAYMDHHGYP
jgi:hypothetical protein